MEFEDNKFYEAIKFLGVIEVKEYYYYVEDEDSY
jgi:hypothetical protein